MALTICCHAQRFGGDFLWGILKEKVKQKRVNDQVDNEIGPNPELSEEPRAVR